MSLEEKGNWRVAIELGARLGLIPTERLAEALRKLDAHGDDAPSANQVAAWVGRSAAEVEGLLALVPHVPADTPTARLHETVRSHGEAVSSLARALGDPRSTPPTVPITDEDMPTAKLGTPAADTPTVAPPTAAPRANIPRRLGPYVLGEELGHGGMGIVFRARHEKLGSACAVKVMIAGEHASAEAIARFQREAATVARMGKHPNIVTVFDLGQEGALAYYAMELVEGKSLRARMREREYTPEESAALVEKVARAVHFAHEHGVIHRDLKPENVVVRKDGEPQVMDFGLARDVSSEDRLSAAGQVMGTLGYMAPEQARGDLEGMDARTDVYALGGILYDLFTGIPPHRGNNQAVLLACILRGDILAPRKLRPDLPRDLETVCMKALSIEPSRRYSTAEALGDDLARFQRGEPVLARPVGRVERFVRRVKRHPLVSTLVGGMVALVLGLAWNLGLLAPARITVTAYPADAKLEAIGTTLWGGRWVWPARPFRLVVSAPGWEPVTREVKASPGARIDLGQVTVCGYLSVETRPEGAEVLLDGKPTAHRTPLTRVEIGTGRHQVSFRLGDHEEESRFVTIEEDKELSLGMVGLMHAQGTLALTGNPAGMSVSVRREPVNPVKGHEHEGPELMRLSPPVTVPLDTGTWWLVGQLKDHFERRQWVEVRRGQELRVNVSLNRQLAWSFETGGRVDSSPALGDVNGDGCLDCVVGSNLSLVYCLSGKDGALLTAFVMDGEVGSSPALGDINGDGCLDCVVGSVDKKVYALSGRNGAVLWSYKTGGEVRSSPALGDTNGDGLLNCVVGSDDHRVYVLPVRRFGPPPGVWGHGRPVLAAALTRYGLLRHDGSWRTIEETASERVQTADDPWVRAVAWLHLGLARLRLGDPKAAIDALSKSREPFASSADAFRLRAPDGAVFEWLASWRWAECPADRRAEARKVLLDALAFQPDTVFDAFVEVRDLLTPEALTDLRTVLDTLPSDNADSQIARAMLLAAFARAAAADLFIAAESRVLAKLQAAEGNAARCLGCLALLADAQGDKDRFRRAYATYLDQPRRPESLDALLAEIAAHKDH